MTKRIGILTSGGDCAGLNATIRAVALRAHHGHGWTTVGLRYGTLGLLERPVEAVTLDPDRLSAALARQGIECEVVAPSSIPKRPGDRIKTDRRDARNLARLYRAGELTAIYVPQEDDEAMRDLVRGRQDAINAQRKARQQLGGFVPQRHTAAAIVNVPPVSQYAQFALQAEGQPAATVVVEGDVPCAHFRRVNTGPACPFTDARVVVDNHHAVGPRVRCLGHCGLQICNNGIVQAF